MSETHNGKESDLELILYVMGVNINFSVFT